MEKIITTASTGQPMEASSLPPSPILLSSSSSYNNPRKNTDSTLSSSLVSSFLPFPNHFSFLLFSHSDLLILLHLLSRSLSVSSSSEPLPRILLANP